jgi:serine protease AprX
VTHWRKLVAGAAATLVCLLGAAAPAAAKPGDHYKLDRKLNDRASRGGSGLSRVIIQVKPGWDGSNDFKRFGKLGKKLGLINGQVVELPNGLLKHVADLPFVESIHWDRPTGGQMNRAAVTVGARSVQQDLGLDGAGVGVAIIDSGVANWHDDLTYQGANAAVRVVGGQRIAKFVDFVNGRTTAYDDYGHGTHVAGIIAGNGYDSYGDKAGIAPAAHLVSLKVLDDHGAGYVSDVIAALGWAVQNRIAYNIRVINLSVGAPVTESYISDPLTLAAKRAVDVGIVVVAAAGNMGRSATGKIVYGGITAPGNAPWVLTVGAYSHQGTVTRKDDVMAPYSSHGPTALDYNAKPDVVAPGTGIVSLAAAGSTMYQAKAAYLLNGARATAYKPYLSLTGTSMAAPMVSGTAALMIQANPKLTPNLVKAIIEYTAQDYHYDALTEGAGFLNSRGAVDLAKFYVTARAGQRYPFQKAWSRTILWGNYKLDAGVIRPAANAWALKTVWGGLRDSLGENIVWGTLFNDGENIVWGTSVLDTGNLLTSLLSLDENIVWGTMQIDENIVWGTLRDAENIVWGTTCDSADCFGVVWGTSLLDAENIVWGTSLLDENIVWGTSGSTDDVIWATSDETDDPPPLFDDVPVGSVSFDSLFPPELAPDSSTTTSTTTTEQTTPMAPITTTVPDLTTGLLGGL